MCTFTGRAPPWVIKGINPFRIVHLTSVFYISADTLIKLTRAAVEYELHHVLETVIVIMCFFHMPDIEPMVFWPGPRSSLVKFSYRVQS